MCEAGLIGWVVGGFCDWNGIARGWVVSRLGMRRSQFCESEWGWARLFAINLEVGRLVGRCRCVKGLDLVSVRLRFEA